MMKVIYNQNIAFSNAQSVVNAANGIGYMGGKRCISDLHKGVSENIQYISKGEVEKLSREQCKKEGLLDFSSSNVFVTAAPNMHTDCIIHAVTIRMPGSKSKLKNIISLVPRIISIAEELNLTTVAVPLLGTGTERLPYYPVYHAFQELFSLSSVEFWVYQTSTFK